ncbi:MAG: hypothetical protein A2736_00865 [Candidatus Yanofskybacteria bacterium RIFCSPHIGHO2_01_FULL_41_27]|uniref:Uncharacterized protein n=2 Tax=Candidatus Yanofskyibacteriota TaxID=1752733 RepID=A0A1F8HU48_9BACT|nr:MAG: hypothetical protein A2736_00865 [Candidatus Yanofskybacteria bacterium RIFCSPHIGHO2_01_FULL_41_27]OGN09266.1 MAG: hypothetical protein A3C64_01600 [Candidatus Yanofskybacteria bacterium RIFCSPHIGHO2_02_FULL_41_12]OGN19927.1 MAG: hypothetical protein A3B00_00290 [Candidatus Yanofskybacteria bacterium RIFCSPLOWO2_01_FULL_41_33]OGN41101.1 MAG: hypothetical protein A2606_02885 [Candidatus Yanofskybacteria bacterium RIFOXYD1_FULL_42_10]
MINLIPQLSEISILPILFIFIFCFYWIYSFFIVYHLVRFGIGTKPKFIAFIFMMGSLLLFTAFVYAAVSTNWEDLLSRVFDASSIFLQSY